MPVPWEALLPFGLLTAMFAATGTGFKALKFIQNDGKAPRYGIDEWDKMMMERDQRLTGSMRGQSAETTAPPEFQTNSVWETEKLR